MSRRVALTLEYDGTGLCGWQRQDNGPTVQQHVEEALTTLLKTPTQVVGASRTDAGVHARGQVCHLDLEHSIPCEGLAHGLNSLLPPQIAVTGAREVDGDFHARFSARGKHYQYRLFIGPTRSPLDGSRAWHIKVPLNLDSMRQAGELMLGERDFSAFRASGCSAKTATRRIHSIRIETGPTESVFVHVRGNAFLRNMVRIVAGTLVEVGRGRLLSENIEEIIASRDRTRAGQTAPATGLTLVRVYFDERELIM